MTRINATVLPASALRFFGIGTLLLFLAYFNPNVANAQQHFEGQLGFQMINAKNGSVQDMSMLVKENRLRFLGSLENYAELPMLSGGLTLRADKNDMLLFSENQKVVVLNMRELSGFLNQMMGNGAQEPADPEVPQTRLDRGDDERSFHDMRAEQYILTSAENPDDEIRIWASDELYIDWETLMGPLSELSKNMNMDFDINGIEWPMELTPLYAEIYENGELTNTIEMVEFESRRFVNNELDIPDGYQPISLFELMMQQN